LGKSQHRKDADILLISHNHFDHLSVEDIKQVINSKTSIVAAKECVDQLESLSSDITAVKPGDKVSVQGIPIEAVAAYNTNKTFHPKADGKVGFVITLNNTRIYHAADTDIIPEMSSVHPDVALVPVSGTYVMTSEEAARAINEKIKPAKLAIPMHYAAIVGTEKDAEKFKELVKVCPVQILALES
ncbi:MAG: Zn-dependent hydrolase, partial [Nitrososphaera sp.]|nr:Zn-dependent hydrolase [Nitrososphaera sp.]